MAGNINYCSLPHLGRLSPEGSGNKSGLDGFLVLTKAIRCQGLLYRKLQDRKLHAQLRFLFCGKIIAGIHIQGENKFSRLYSYPKKHVLLTESHILEYLLSNIFILKIIIRIFSTSTFSSSRLFSEYSPHCLQHFISQTLNKNSMLLVVHLLHSQFPASCSCPGPCCLCLTAPCCPRYFLQDWEKNQR